MKDVKRTVQPADEPVSLAEALDWLKIEAGFDDARISALITAARQMVETYLNRTMIDSTWSLTKQTFPFATGSATFYDGDTLGFSDVDYQDEADFYGISPSSIHLPMGDVSSIVSVQYYDKDNNIQTVASDVYFLGSDNAIHLNESKGWPGLGDMRNSDAVRINYVAGYGAEPDLVPQDLKTVILMTVEAMYESGMSCVASLPPLAMQIAAPYALAYKSRPNRRTIERG